MALISISSILSKSFLSTGGTFVEFDGYLNVTPVTSNIITGRPVEDGYDLNDAVHNNRKTLAVEIIITDTPQSIIDKRSVTNLPNVFGIKLLQTHTKRQLNNLQAISDKRETITLTTKYSEYEDYFIESFAYSETTEQGLRITFNLIENRTNQVQEETANISDSIGLWS